MAPPPLDAARRAYLAERLELEESRRRGDTPSKEAYADAVVDLLDAMTEHELHREILEVSAEVLADRDVSGPIRAELAHRRVSAGVAIGNRSVVTAALRVLRRDLEALRGRARETAARELAKLERDTEAALAAQEVAPEPVVAQRYAHTKFGVGVEIGGTRESIRLRFADGTERSILRSKVTAV